MNDLLSTKDFHFNYDFFLEFTIIIEIVIHGTESTARGFNRVNLLSFIST